MSEEQRQRIADLYLQQRSQDEIATQLNITLAEVSGALKTIQTGWRLTAQYGVDEARARELARIDNLEREYWDAWQASKEGKELTTSERSDGSRATAKVKIVRERRVGDAQYLAGVQWCISKRCEILGLAFK